MYGVVDVGLGFAIYAKESAIGLYDIKYTTVKAKHIMSLLIKHMYMLGGNYKSRILTRFCFY
ncbi:hypothetical protein U9K47_14415 [Bacillus toyonensis]|uniref:hypothetical protein n=1 Tax=Bacillus toyonensis TaxID=155322 RepID=UPI0034679938